MFTAGRAGFCCLWLISACECAVSSQFGAFHFGARQVDACQFGVFHFDAVPVRHVSVWRDASLAHFTSARFPFLCLCSSQRVIGLQHSKLVYRRCFVVVHTFINHFRTIFICEDRGEVITSD